MTDHRSKMFRSGNLWCSGEKLERLRREADLGDDPDAEERYTRAQARCGADKAYKRIEAITIEGRRWFDRRYANTYHTSRILVKAQNEDKTIELIVPFTYGYDDHFMTTAQQALIAARFLPPLKGRPRPLAWWARKHGIQLDYTVIDVKRKKDLHLGGKR